MNITETIINVLIKRGLGGDMKNFKTTIEIPNQDSTKTPVKVTITADALQIKIERE